jgi:hypothetical protein
VRRGAARHRALRGRPVRGRARVRHWLRSRRGRAELPGRVARRGRWTAWMPGQPTPMHEPLGMENPEPSPVLACPDGLGVLLQTRAPVRGLFPFPQWLLSGRSSLHPGARLRRSRARSCCGPPCRHTAVAPKRQDVAVCFSSSRGRDIAPSNWWEGGPAHGADNALRKVNSAVEGALRGGGALGQPGRQGQAAEC